MEGGKAPSAPAPSLCPQQQGRKIFHLPDTCSDALHTRPLRARPTLLPPPFPLSLSQSKGPVGLHSLTQNSNKAWSSEINTDNGIAMKVCMYLDPTALVRSRFEGCRGEGAGQLTLGC